MSEKKENILSCYYMPRNLSKYGGQFCIEYVPESDDMKSYYNVFIRKPEWSNDFAGIHVGDHKQSINNFVIKGIKFVSIDALIVKSMPNIEQANEYRDLEKKLHIVGTEQEIARSEGRWMQYMEDHVESLESLKARGKDVVENH